MFHIAAFEANKAASLRPDVFDLGPFADLGTERFRELWSTVLRHVWGQWRYENGLADYAGPEIVGAPAAPHAPAPPVADAERRILLFCGGGKDSLVAGRVLEEAGLRVLELRVRPQHLRAARAPARADRRAARPPGADGRGRGTGCSTTSSTRPCWPSDPSSACAR